MDTSRVRAATACIVASVCVLVIAPVDAVRAEPDADTARVLDRYRASGAWRTHTAYTENQTHEYQFLDVKRERGVLTGRNEATFRYVQDGTRAVIRGRSIEREPDDPPITNTVVSVSDPAARPYVVSYHGPAAPDNIHAIAYPNDDALRMFRATSYDIVRELDGYTYDGHAIRGGLAIDEALRRCADLSVDRDVDVDGVPCIAIGGSCDQGSITLYLDPEAGYLARRFTLVRGPDDLWHGKPVSGWKDWVYKDKFWSSRRIELSHVEIETIDGVPVPVAGRIRETAVMADGTERHYDRWITRTDVSLTIGPKDLEQFENLPIPDASPITFRLGADAVEGLRYEWRDGQVKPAFDDEVVRQIDETVAALGDDEAFVSDTSHGRGSEGSGANEATGPLSLTVTDSATGSVRTVLGIGFASLALVIGGTQVWRIRRGSGAARRL